MTPTFVGLCLVVFIAVCNSSVFYGFQVYLQHLGFDKSRAGLLVSAQALSAMTLYASFSGLLNLKNAPTVLAAGITLLLCCGLSYPYVSGFWAFAGLRLAQGAGGFMVLAPCLTILVSIIPPGRSGSAFSLYSVALLAPYSIIPALSERLAPFVPSQAWLYFYCALLYLPALCIVRPLASRLSVCRHSDPPAHKHTRATRAALSKMFTGAILAVLIMNCVYFTFFNSLFFLFKDFTLSRNIEQTGVFFTVQMGVMVALRLMTGRLFDVADKRLLVCMALVMTGGGFAMLYVMHDATLLIPAAVVFGLGMGVCTPALNALVFLASEPPYRAFNANMMMLSLHLGAFAGPFLGSWTAEIFGYDVFLIAAASTGLVSGISFLYLYPPGPGLKSDVS